VLDGHRGGPRRITKLRADAAECVLISDPATNPEKQELFDVRYRSPVRRPVPAACPVEMMLAPVWLADFISEGIPH
jgi:hypothetical protein